MQISELKQALKQSTLEFEVAMEVGKSPADLKKLYQKLKEIQYQITMLEASIPQEEKVY